MSFYRICEDDGKTAERAVDETAVKFRYAFRCDDECFEFANKESWVVVTFSGHNEAVMERLVTAAFQHGAVVEESKGGAS